MRLEQLEYLAAVTRYGSLRQASEHIHVSQPAMSQALRKLERELSVVLLERSSSGSKASPQGAALLSGVGDVLGAVDRLRDAAAQQSSAAHLLRIGTVHAGTMSLVVPALRSFGEQHPRTQVEVQTRLHAGVQRQVIDGALDLGLVNLLPGDDVSPSLHRTALLSGRPVVCMASGDPLAAYDEIDADLLASRPIIGMLEGYAMHRVLHRLLGRRPDSVRIRADGAELGKLMVAEGLGVTILPDYSIDKDPLLSLGAITYRPLTDDTTLTMEMVCRDRAGVPPILEALQECLAVSARQHRENVPGSA